MNVLFLTTLESRSEAGPSTAQVTVAEHQGSWHIVWNEQGSDGRAGQETWYDGGRWDDMMESFRHCMQAKLGEGYVPLFETPLADPADWLGERYARTLLLHYYSEKNGKDELYEKLRKWRREQAEKEGKSPFIVASNKLLRLISAFAPQSVGELEQLPGFGEQRAKLYGEAIARLTAEYAEPGTFPLDWVESAVDRNEFTLWIREQKEARRKAGEEKEQVKHAVLERLDAGDGIEDLAKTLGLKRRDAVAWLEELDKAGYEVDRIVEAELLAVPEEQYKLAWQTFAKLGDRYLKPVMEAVYGGQPPAKELDTVYEWLRLLRIKYRKQSKASLQQANAG